jgi:hypothetical protein
VEQRLIQAERTLAITGGNPLPFFGGEDNPSLEVQDGQR